MAGILVFSPRELADIFSVTKKTAAVFISRNLRGGLFVKLRNNFYILKDSAPSSFFIANKLYQPSYVSLETALSHYGLIPETVYTITSVTTRPTREFKTPRGVFSYQKIKRSVYAGYVPLRTDDGTVLIAEPEKALADYLYFSDLKKSSLNDRLALKNINKQKLTRWVQLFDRPRLLKLVQHIYDEHKKHRTIF